MVSLRYHIVSLAAIFLALALGIVLGATKINSPLLSGLQGDKDTLQAQSQQLTDQNQTLSDQVSNGEKFATAVGPLAVRGVLPNQTVVLITTQATNPADRDAVVSLLSTAGAKVTAQLQLTSNFTDPAQADQLSSLAAQQLPAGAKLPEVPQVGATAGGLLASLLVSDKDGKAPSKPDEASAALSALTSAGFIVASGTMSPGRLVVIITGAGETGGSEADRAAVIAGLANQLKQAAGGVVVVGRSGADSATGAVGVIRQNAAYSAQVSTVDDVQTDAGRIATVLALAEQAGGQAGQYGTGSGATAPVPTLAVG